MKIIILLFLPLFLLAGQIKTHIIFSGDTKVALKIVHQSFYMLGYRLDISDIAVHSECGDMDAIANGNKPLSLSHLNENFKEQAVIVNSASVEQGILKLDLNFEQAHWTIPLIGSEEGVELQRSTQPHWFRIDGGKIIRFEPPYNGKWYPDIAVLDRSLNVLYSWRATIPKEIIELSLPEDSYYLKVSNTQGMKILKEGMWIESVISEH